MTRASIAFTAITILLVIVMAIVIATHWTTIASNFYNIRLIELLQLLLTVSIAFFISYYINDRLHVSIKKREILVELLSNFSNKINDIYSSGNEYIASPNPNKQKHILRLLKNTSILLKILHDLRENKSIKCQNIKDEEIYRNFISFKESLTEDPFGQRTPHYTSDQISKYDEAYRNLIDIVLKCKILVYT